MDTRMPIVASVTDAARNMYGAFQLGFNRRGFYAPFYGAGRKGLSVGGLATAGGLAGVGAAAGAAAGALMADDPLTIGAGAAVGAGAGLAALPFAGLATRAVGAVGLPLMRGVGSAMFAAPPILGGIAKGMVAGAAGFNPVIGGNFLSRGIGSLGSPLRRHTQGLVGLGASMIRHDLDADNLSKIKLTNPISGAKLGWEAGNSKIGKALGAAHGAIFNGQTLIWGAAAVSSIAGVMGEYERIHMGRSDGQVTRLAPRTPYYQNNAGATGDLVFALNANRRG